jgi:hypothetical protein
MNPLAKHSRSVNESNRKGKRNMNQFRCFRTFGLIMLASALNLTTWAQAGSADAIQQKLLSQFHVTTITADRSDIVTPGSVVQLRLDGLMMYSVNSPVVPSNNYKDGKISQGFLFKRLRLPGQPDNNLLADGNPLRMFVHGENFWVSAISMKNDGVEFRLYSDPYNDVRFDANLKIPFPSKNEVPSADQMMTLVGQVLTVVPAQEQAVSAPAPAAPQSAPAPPPASYGEIAPPPPPPAPPQTISVGMNKDQVVAVFGEPERKAVVGPKEIYFYSDLKMKIIFTNGKVSNVD